MLMISRRVGERIVIDGDIEVFVTEIRRRSVRLGVSGGEGKLIVRGEVHDSIVAANQTAADAHVDEAVFEELFATSPSTSGDACSRAEPAHQAATSSEAP